MLPDGNTGSHCGLLLKTNPETFHFSLFTSFQLSFEFILIVFKDKSFNNNLKSFHLLFISIRYCFINWPSNPMLNFFVTKCSAVIHFVYQIHWNWIFKNIMKKTRLFDSNWMVDLCRIYFKETCYNVSFFFQKRCYNVVPSATSVSSINSAKLPLFSIQYRHVTE